MQHSPPPWSWLLLPMKMLITGCLITWLIRQERLQFHRLGELFSHRLDDWLAALCLLITTTFLVSLRWKTLLDLKAEHPIPYGRTLSISWTSLLFAPLLPGSVSGDMIKVLYAKKLDRRLSPSYLISSTLLDRIFGLTALIIIAGVASCLTWNQTLLPLMLTNLGLLAICASGVLFLLAPPSTQKALRRGLVAIPWLGPLVTVHIFDHIILISQKKHLIASCLAISLTSQMIHILTFWWLSYPELSAQISLTDLAVIFPLGVLTTAIPITPLGLGVGHLAFDKLFNFYGVTGGANYFNAYIMTTAVHYLLGFIPYLMGKKK